MRNRDLVGRAWAASQPGHRVVRGCSTRTYAADLCEVSRDGLQGDGEVVDGVGERCLLPGGERPEPEAAADHEVGLTSERTPPPNHGTPDHLGGKGTRLARRREFEGASGPEAERGEVLDLRPRQAEIPEESGPAG